MTDKITRADAERLAREEVAKITYNFNLRYEKLSRSESIEDAVYWAEKNYQEKLAELAPRIIPESITVKPIEWYRLSDTRWRPIEECPKGKERIVLLAVRGPWAPIMARIKDNKFCSMISDEEINLSSNAFYTEIPALPDEVAS